MMPVSSGSPFKGACVFGTASGLAIRGIGCLAEPSRGLLRLLDFGTQKFEVGETAWFALPFSVGTEHGRIIGQVGFTSDFKGREGFVGVAAAVTDDSLLNTGYSGAVHLVGQLFPWFSQSFDATQGDATFAQADSILLQLQLQSSTAAEVPHHEEPLRLRLPENWQSFISTSELMGILPGYVQYTEIARRGYVMRTNQAAPHDVTLSEQFLSTWRLELYGPKERQKLEAERARLTDALNKTLEAYKEQERYSASLKSDADKQAQLVAALQEQVKAEAADRARLTKEMAVKKSEVEATAKAAHNLDKERKKLQAHIDDTTKRLDAANAANSKLLERYNANQARFQQLDGQLKETHSQILAKARAELAREKQALESEKLSLEATIAQQQRVLDEAAKSIRKIQSSELDLREQLADAKLTIAANFPSNKLHTLEQPVKLRDNQDQLQDPDEPVPKSSRRVLGTVLSFAAIAMFFLWGSVCSMLPDNIGCRLTDREVHLLARIEKLRKEEVKLENRVLTANSFQKLTAEKIRLMDDLNEVRSRMKEIENANRRLLVENEQFERNQGREVKELGQQLQAASIEVSRQRSLVSQAEDQARRDRETAEGSARTVESLKQELVALKSLTDGASAISRDGATAYSATMLPSPLQAIGRIGNPESSPPTAVERCGMNPEYRKTVELGRYCTTQTNYELSDCKVPRARTDFANLAVELPKCPIANSACKESVSKIQSANALRLKKGWNWHDGLAVAMDETLKCVESAWASSQSGHDR